MKNIFIDCEWNPRNHAKLFLIGYSYNLSSFKTLIETQINAYNLKRILKPVTGHIFVYGPDIGFMEKHLGIDIRNNYSCVNLLTAVKNEIPGLPCYKLYKIEQYLKIRRNSMSYKYDIFRILKDWKTITGRKKVIAYNKEDVINLVRVFYHLRRKGLTKRKLLKYRIH